MGKHISDTRTKAHLLAGTYWGSSQRTPKHPSLISGAWEGDGKKERKGKGRRN